MLLVRRAPYPLHEFHDVIRVARDGISQQEHRKEGVRIRWKDTTVDQDPRLGTQFLSEISLVWWRMPIGWLHPILRIAFRPKEDRIKSAEHQKVDALFAWLAEKGRETSRHGPTWDKAHRRNRTFDTALTTILETSCCDGGEKRIGCRWHYQCFWYVWVCCCRRPAMPWSVHNHHRIIQKQQEEYQQFVLLLQVVAVRFLPKSNNNCKNRKIQRQHLLIGNHVMSCSHIRTLILIP